MTMKKKIIEAEDDDEEQTIKGGIFSNFSANYYTNFKQNTLSSISKETVNKAILVEVMYYNYFNKQDYDLTDIFLEEKKLDYYEIDRELSIPESLVLINKNIKDIYVKYKGSIIMAWKQDLISRYVISLLKMPTTDKK